MYIHDNIYRAVVRYLQWIFDSKVDLACLRTHLKLKNLHTHYLLIFPHTFFFLFKFMSPINLSDTLGGTTYMTNPMYMNSKISTLKVFKILKCIITYHSVHHPVKHALAPDLHHRTRLELTVMFVHGTVQLTTVLLSPLIWLTVHKKQIKATVNFIPCIIVTVAPIWCLPQKSGHVQPFTRAQVRTEFF